MEVIDFTELYNRYSGDVFRYVRYLTGSREVELAGEVAAPGCTAGDAAVSGPDAGRD